MPEFELRDRRILVVEDEFTIAGHLRTQLEDVGAVVLGPVPTVEDAIALIEQERDIDAVVLDLNLEGKTSFVVADLLIARKIPVIRMSGYDHSTVPAQFASLPHCEKPLGFNSLLSIITNAIDRGMERGN